MTIAMAARVQQSASIKGPRFPCSFCLGALSMSSVLNQVCFEGRGEEFPWQRDSIR